MQRTPRSDESPHSARPLRAAALLAALAALGTGAGCGDESEARVQAAHAVLTEARDEVEAARARVEAGETALDRASEELETARRALRDAELRLAEAETSVDLRASDAILFRTIQRKLLEDADLESVAIRATVERGVVTLRGSVPSPGLRDRAVGIAQTTGGVARVEDEIRVEAPEAADLEVGAGA